MADALAQAVRQQLGLGRLLPLGEARDGAWLTEHAATGVLRTVAGSVPGVRVTTLRIDLADPARVVEPVVPAPPTARWPGPLRVTGEFLATAGQPLPTSAERLRTALYEAATERLGLLVESVDLQVTGLLDGAEADEPDLDKPEAEPTGARNPAAPGQGTAGAGAGRSVAATGRDAAGAGRGVAGSAPATGGRRGETTAVERVSAAVAAVPGVARLAPALGGLTQPVRVESERRTGGVTPGVPEGGATGAAGSAMGGGPGSTERAGTPTHHVQAQVAIAPGHRAVEVARAVRDAAHTALTADAPADVTVAVLVTAVEVADAEGAEGVEGAERGA